MIRFLIAVLLIGSCLTSSFAQTSTRRGFHFPTFRHTTKRRTTTTHLPVGRSGSVYVHGYRTRSGKYVQPYYRHRAVRGTTSRPRRTTATRTRRPGFFSRRR